MIITHSILCANENVDFRLQRSRDEPRARMTEHFNEVTFII